MEQIVAKLNETLDRATTNVLELSAQKGNIPVGGCNDKHPNVLMRCGGIRVFDDRSNVVVSATPDQSGAQPFEPLKTM